MAPPTPPPSPSAAEAAGVAQAAALLRSGGLVAFPTETVYGLGADATNEPAVRRIFTAKGRPEDHPLIVHLASGADVARWAVDVSPVAERLMAAFWPGPLTVVLRRRPGQLSAATGGRDSVGLRVPDHSLALALLAAVEVPVAAPSANRFGRVSPTSAVDVRAELGDLVDLILDGGPSRVGVESTIIELLGPVPLLLRPGGVPLEAIEDVAGARVEQVLVGPARASGMLASHYAPTVTVELVAGGDLALRAEAMQARGCSVAVLAPQTPNDLPVGVTVLAPPADAADYARCLYRRLREAEEAGVDVLLAVAPSSQGLGRAVADRLARAAAPRPDGHTP